MGMELQVAEEEKRGKILLALGVGNVSWDRHSLPVRYAGAMRSKEEVNPSTSGAGCRKISTVS